MSANETLVLEVQGNGLTGTLLGLEKLEEELLRVNSVGLSARQSWAKINSALFQLELKTKAAATTLQTLSKALESTSGKNPFDGLMLGKKTLDNVDRLEKSLRSIGPVTSFVAQQTGRAVSGILKLAQASQKATAPVQALANAYGMLAQKTFKNSGGQVIQIQPNAVASSYNQLTAAIQNTTSALNSLATAYGNVAQAQAKVQTLNNKKIGTPSTIPAAVIPGGGGGGSTSGGSGQGGPQSALGRFANSVGTYVARFGTAVGAIGAGRELAEFEDNLAALSGTIEKGSPFLERFRQQAVDMARDSRQSMTDVAEAQLALVRAGLSEADALRSVNSVISLATAGQMDLGDATEFAVETMTQFRIPLTQIAVSMDKIVKTANMSTTSVKELRTSLKYAGAAGASLGIQFDEMLAALGALAQSGKKGSTGGTSLRQFLVLLAKDSSKVKDFLDEVAKRANVPRQSLDLTKNSLEGVLRALKNSEPSARSVFAAFEKQGGTAFIDLVRNVDLFANEMKDGLRDAAGEAERLRKEMEDTLGGQAKRFLNSIMSAISELNTAAGDPFKSLFSFGADSINGLATYAKTLKEAVAAGDLLAISLKTIATIAAGAALGALASSLGNFIGASAGIVGVIDKMKKLALATLGIQTALDKTGGAFTKFSKMNIVGIVLSLAYAFKDVSVEIDKTNVSLGGLADTFFKKAGMSLKSYALTYQEFSAQKDVNILQLAGPDKADELEKARTKLKAIQAEMEQLKNTWEDTTYFGDAVKRMEEQSKLKKEEIKKDWKEIEQTAKGFWNYVVRLGKSAVPWMNRESLGTDFPEKTKRTPNPLVIAEQESLRKLALEEGNVNEIARNRLETYYKLLDVAKQLEKKDQDQLPSTKKLLELVQAYRAASGMVIPAGEDLESYGLDLSGLNADQLDETFGRLSGLAKRFYDDMKVNERTFELQKSREELKNLASTAESSFQEIQNAFQKSQSSSDKARNRVLESNTLESELLRVDELYSEALEKMRKYNIQLIASGGDLKQLKNLEEAERMLSTIAKNDAERNATDRFKQRYTSIQEMLNTPIDSSNELDLLNLQYQLENLVELANQQTQFDFSGLNIGADQATEQIEKVNEALIKFNQLAEKQTFRNWMKDSAMSLADTFGQSMQSMFDAIIDGAENMEQVMTNIAKSIVSSLVRIFVVEQLVNSLKAGVSSAFGAPQSVNGAGGGFLQQAKGGVHYQGNVQAFARGGVVGSTTYFPMVGGRMGMMGEKGPEAIMPLSRGRDGRLGVMMTQAAAQRPAGEPAYAASPVSSANTDTGQPTVVNVYQNISTRDAPSFKYSTNQLASNLRRGLIGRR